MLLLLLILSCICVSSTHAANILALFPHASESHFAVMRTIVTELANRDHNVTLYTGHRLDIQSNANIREILIEPEFAFWTTLSEYATKDGTLYRLSRLPTIELQKALAHVGAVALDHFLSQANVQGLLKLTKTQFSYDLIIVDLFHTEALLALAHKHQVPIIGIVSTNFGDYMDAVLDNIVPSACTPYDFDQETNFSYWQRCNHIRQCMNARQQFTQLHLGAQQQLIQKHFAIEAPSLTVLQRQWAVLLLNNHMPLLKPRTLLPNTIHVGGLHVRAPQELPWHLKRYMDAARSGVIYINFGNEQLCKALTKPRLKLLFDVLRKRKESVLWTCHDVQQFDDMPGNLMIQHAVPQSDILAHPHVRLFLMNGDLLSVQEGIVRHVPMLGVPLFANEKRNMDLVEQLNVGIQLEYENVTSTSLNWAFDALLNDAQYAVAIRQVARQYRERPLGALATAMFWIDFVLNYKDSVLLKANGIGTNHLQLHLFDLFVFYCALLLFLIAGVGAASYWVFRYWKRRRLNKLFSKLR